jgi:hypothetical protein
MAGEIIHIGPDYASLVGSSSANQDWTSSFLDYFQDGSDLERIRETNELYMAELLELRDSDVARIFNIANPHVTAWRKKEGGPDTRSSYRGHALEHEYQEVLAHSKVEDGAPRVCMTSELSVGLVPTNAAVGDVIIRFHESNAAIVMRPSKTIGSASFFMLVGRADVTGQLEIRGDERRRNHTACLLKTAPSKYMLDDQDDVFVDMNLRTLQRITAHTIIERYEGSD